MLYPIALTGLFPLDDDGLANELIVRKALLRSHHFVVVARIDVPEVSARPRAVYRAEIALCQWLQLEVRIIVEFYTV